MLRKLLLLTLLGVMLIFAGLRFNASWPWRSATGFTSGVDPFAGKIIPDAPAGPVVLTEDKARLLHAQVARGDFKGGAERFAAVLTASKMEAWRFFPMGEFMDAVTGGKDHVYLEGLNEWVSADKASDVPWLLRARYYHDMSWQARGSDYFNKIPPARFRLYEELRSLAIADVNAALAINDRNPYSFYLLLVAEGSEAAFRRGIAKYPAYYPLYKFWLGRLEPKWGGSVDEMYAFVHEFADPTPPGSPMKLLYLDLYDDLLGMASSGCRQYTSNDLKRCVAFGADQMITKQLADNLRAAALLYAKVDPSQYSHEMLGRLKGLANRDGAEVRAATILQEVADAMHGSTALVPDKSLSTHFVLDQAAGNVWFHAGRNDNAETLYLRSLADLKSFVFPNEEHRLRTIGAAYDSLASIYMESGQFEKVLAARNMAERFVGVAGGSRSAAKCEALFNLSRFNEAVDACTKLMDVHPTFAALRFRGKSYMALGMADKALVDLTRVAASDYRYNGSAAIDLTLIYGGTGDYDRMLQVFSTYPLLFDPEEQTRRMVAVAYNNRCYAYLKLRQLKLALNDCEKSLQFDTIPDAMQKKQEIMAILDSH